jgi:Fe-S cluster biogenesis protein NfuA
LKENMAKDTALQKRIERIAAIVQEFESSADPNVRNLAGELMECVMALHGSGLERILEIASELGETGEAIIRKCGRDDLVSSLLLLYGLHPDDLPTRVTRAIEQLRGFLESHAAKAELISIGDDGTLTLRLDVKSSGCGSSASGVKATFEAAIQNAAPDAPAIIIEETGAALHASSFVSIAQLKTAQSLTAASAATALRSGD